MFEVNAEGKKIVFSKRLWGVAKPLQLSGANFRLGRQRLNGSPMMENHRVWTNQRTMPATNTATTNCTKNNLPQVARANAAIPPGVSGCHAKGGFSACASIQNVSFISVPAAD